MDKNPYRNNKNYDILQDKYFYARATFSDPEKQAVMQCLNEFQLSPGKYSWDFEKEVAKLFSKDFGVFVNSGSSALLLAAELLDIREGDEIITGASGFPTTINPFLLKGATVVLVDVNPETVSPKLDQIEAAITPRTKAIVVAHIWGATLDMPKLREIADRHNIKLVSDSCDTLGAKIDGKPTGYWSDISVTSFFPSHVITACGGGGMICVKTEKEEKLLREFRDWGRRGTDSEDLEDRFNVDLQGIPYDAKFCYGVRGYNLKATEVQAAFGLVQLKSLEKWNVMRLANYNRLKAIVENLGLKAVKPSVENVQPSWLAFPFLTDNRTELAKHLERNNIQTRPILAGNFIRHEAFQNANIRTFGGMKVLEGADEVARRGLGIGLHQDVKPEQIEHFEQVIKEFFNEKV